MACELIGAKLLAPYFGTSLYVWASALGLTLGGLTTGYFIGGKLSKKYNQNYDLLFNVLILAGLLLVLMPFLSHLVMDKFIDLPLEIGSMISLLIFMVPPLIFMGMTSPIIISLLTNEAVSAGNNAGNVYAISTVGGILYTFLLGFTVIPNLGLSLPALICGTILTLAAAVGKFNINKKQTILTILILFCFSWLGSRDNNPYNEDYKILYQSEGILGQVKVVDHPSYAITKPVKLGRALIVNNTLQTYVGKDRNFDYSIWQWSHFFPTAASIHPPGAKVLLLGLGGGTLVKQLKRLEYEVDVVEIDRRIWDVSVKYFNLDQNTNIYIDDARHYIKSCHKKYDIIIYDTFLSESVPEHLLTLEGFEDAKNLLNPGGMIMSNFYGFLSGKKGKAARSVYKTFKDANLKVNLLATPGNEENRNLIFIASEANLDFSKTNYSEPNYPQLTNLEDYFILEKDIDLKGIKVLSDYKPRLAKLYNSAAVSWKKSYNQYYHEYFNKKNND